MTTAQAVGAVSSEAKEWYAIDWRTIHRNVRRLQVRIAQATKEGRWGKVRALQRLLTHSYSGKVLAVRRVTENAGKKTPGVDREIWDTPEKKTWAVHELKRRGYQPKPLRRVYIPKSDGQTLRPLGIPTMTDRAMQALHLLALDPVAETTADKNSYGFRQQRSCADAIQQCFNALTNASTQWILEGDIRSCFDRISHDWLLAHVPMDRAILRKWLKSGYMDKRVFHETTEGTPQGGIVSPALANMALDGLERVLKEKYPSRPLKSWDNKNPSVNFIRYADDFIVTGRSKDLLERDVKPLIEQFLRERGLELSPTKIVITHVKIGFDFLGQNVRRCPDGKRRIKPSKKNVKTFLDDIRKTIKAALGSSAADLIKELNPKIRGWANYHRHTMNKSTFARVDHEIFSSLWRWARRRHPRKTARWRKQKYFAQHGDQDWSFFGEMWDGDGQPSKIWLLRASSTPIKRHIKVKADANPYDPAYETYFEEREEAHSESRFGVPAFFAFFGMNRVVSARFAISRSPGLRVGACTIASLARWVAQPAPRTASCFIPSAMTGFTASVFPYPNRVSFPEAFEALEPDDGKLSRPVLRGLGPSNGVRLLDLRKSNGHFTGGSALRSWISDKPFLERDRCATVSSAQRKGKRVRRTSKGCRNDARL